MASIKFNPFFSRTSAVTAIASQTELAKALGVNRSAVTQAKKKDSVPDKWILQLSRKFDLNPEWLATGRGDRFLSGLKRDDSAFTTIPKVAARLSAGGGSFEVGEAIKGYYSFRKDWLTPKGNSAHMVLMDIFGNSMEPELKDGDTVLIDESQKAVLAGAMYAVGIDDTVMVKRVEKRPNKLVLLSDNRDYLPIYLEGDEMERARIIGKVIWLCRELN